MVEASLPRYIAQLATSQVHCAPVASTGAAVRPTQQHVRAHAKAAGRLACHAGVPRTRMPAAAAEHHRTRRARRQPPATPRVSRARSRLLFEDGGRHCHAAPAMLAPDAPAALATAGHHRQGRPEMLGRRDAHARTSRPLLSGHGGQQSPLATGGFGTCSRQTPTGI
jgi:hypothetical protein